MRGLFSFAVAIFAALVMLYFVAGTVAISQYQAMGQSRLQMQMISQTYNDALQVYDDAVVDAVLDSAYASNVAAPCNGAASGDLENALFGRVRPYTNLATANLSSAFGDRASISSYWMASSLVVDTSPGQQTLTPPCSAGETLTMNRALATVFLPLNITSINQSTGAFSRPFQRSYDILVNYSATSNSFTVLVRRDGADIRCVNVAC